MRRPGAVDERSRRRHASACLRVKCALQVASESRRGPLRPSRPNPFQETRMRVFNFSAGPAVLPETVLRQAAAEMLDWHGSGMSVMEMSHRGKEFISIADKAEEDPRTLLVE